ncbi:MAG: AAA family ATPase [Peptostreptococcaceae bacterium]|nr:AAA family ATPase [Peptostreptococcaceae bacterium]
MKPISVRIKGLNSFVEEQVVDFEKLCSQGLFGIFGPTGSGKSTVLDAITFALYGKIARETGKHSEYINTNSETARVVFEFEVNAQSSKRYKITRELKRNKKGAVQTSECKVVCTTDDEVLADKERNATDAIKKIIGLEYSDFVKTVVLPQGGFNDFLKMEGKERREVLERLFNLQKYGKHLEDKISSQMRKVEFDKKEIEGQLKAYGDIHEDALKEQEKLLSDIREKITQAENEKKIHDPVFEKIKMIFGQQKDLENLEEVLRKEMAKEDRMKELARQIENSTKAKILEPLIKDYDDLKNRGKSVSEEYEELKNEHAKLSEEKKITDAEFLEIDEKKEREHPELIKRAEALKSAVGLWEDYLEYEKRLKELVRELGVLKKTLEDKDDEKKKVAEQKQSLDIKIEQDKAWIKENHISQVEKNRLSEAVILFDKRQERLVQKEALGKEIKAKQDGSSKLTKEIEQLKRRSEEIEKAKEHWQNEQKLCKSSPFADPMYLLNKKQELSRDLEQAEQAERIKKDLKAITRSVNELEVEQNDLAKRQQEIEGLYKAEQSAFQDRMLHDAAHRIRYSLHAGDTCPVCMQIVGDLNETTDVEDQQGFAQKMAELKQNMEKLSGIREDLAKQKGSLEQRSDHLENEKQKLLEQLSQTAQDIRPEVLKERFEKQEQESSKILQKLQICEEKLSELQQDEIRVQNEKTAKDATYKALSEQLEKDLLSKQKITEELEEIGEKLYAIFDKNSAQTPKEMLEQMNKTLERSEMVGLEIEKADKKRIEIVKQAERIEQEIVELKAEQREKNIRNEEWSRSKEKISAQLEKLLGAVGDPKAEIEKVEIAIRQLGDVFEQRKKAKEAKDIAVQHVLDQKNASEQSLKDLRGSAREKQRTLYEKIQQQGIAYFTDLSDQQKLETLNRSIKIVSDHMLSDEIVSEKKALLEEHYKIINVKQGEIAGIKKQIGDRKVTQEEFDEITEKDREINKRHNDLVGEHAAAKQRYDDTKIKLEQIKDLCAKEKKIADRFEMLKELKTVLGARKFVEFMAMKQLNYVTLEATEQLFNITNGAYSLEVDEEGAFKIRDNKNGGAIRNVKTLSGGETFVVSLSLALALSAQIQLKGVAPLELFFLDEGFGTLDDELLEVVMDSLEKIRHDKLSIGIISHVEQLKQRIPLKLMITPARSGEGGSKAKIEYS